MLYERNIVHKTKEYTLFSSPKRFTKHNTIHQEFQIECGKSSPSDLAFILAGVEGLISSLDYTEIKINRVVSDDGGLFIAIFADLTKQKLH
jgi:hypothetical protein